MPKRDVRPWDNGMHFKERLAQAEAILAVPSVELDGVKFKSDRFYLHSLQDETPPKPTCLCGSNEAPPLFPREAFVDSLDLKAAIFGTYTVSLEWMTRTFPHLVGPSSSVPTLILHGHKGLTNRLVASCEEDDDIFSVETEPQENSQPSIGAFKVGGVDFRLPPVLPTLDKGQDDASTIDGGGSLFTQDGITTSSPAFFRTENFIRSPLQSQTPQKELFANQATKEGKKITTRITMSSLGSCQLTQIISNWKPPTDANVSEEPSGGNVDNDTRRQVKRGVHHPKFMLLFEKSGDLVVVVSTANLSKTKSVEGSWIQRFSPRRRPVPTVATTNNSRGDSATNDFGITLTDFLRQLSSSAMSGQTKVEEFFTQHLAMELDDLPGRYHFEKAQVHLVPVIPGDLKGKPKKNQRFVYGRQRVHHVLSQLPDLVKSSKDTLLIQPTSFGGNWRQSELTDLVRSYMGYDRSTRPNEFWDEDALLRRVRIIWPTYTFMRGISDNQREVNQPSKPNSELTDPILFMSSQLFNSCERGCVSRMARYESSIPSQRLPLVPHFKSIARLYGKSLKNKSMSADECFSWFLMTSACFSLGAQGKGVASLEKENAKVEYANFELGVLFTSRARESRGGGDRIYCFHPAECSCNRHTLYNSSNRIHLPVPYCLQPKLYMEEENDGKDDNETEFMQETPYFHEIEAGNRCVGNMLLTPYGIEQKNKMRQKVSGSRSDRDVSI